MKNIATYPDDESARVTGHRLHPLRDYTRWLQASGGQLRADILSSAVAIVVDPARGMVALGDVWMSPDEARLIGVRLVEGAGLADGGRSVRRAPVPTA